MAPRYPASHRGDTTMDEETVNRMPLSTASPDTTTELLTPVQAAQAIGVSLWTIRDWIRRGHLPAGHRGHRRVIAPAELAAVHARLHLGGIVPTWRQDRQR